jgi:hypothetical protein
MKNILILCLLIVAPSLLADGYHARFWRGMEKDSFPTLRKYCDDRHSDCFAELINRWLIPATPSYAAKDTLMGYAPVLLPKKYPGLFREIALIVYSDEASYRKLRDDKENIEGSTYGPIHGDIFDMGTYGEEVSSRTLVSIPFTGSLKLENVDNKLAEVSYDLLNTKTDLVASTAGFFIVERAEMQNKKFAEKVEASLTNLQELADLVNIRAAYVLAAKDYVMVYVFSENIIGVNASAEVFGDDGLKIGFGTNLKPLEKLEGDPLLYTPLRYGEGGNLQFEPGTKPGTAYHYRLEQEN